MIGGPSRCAKPPVNVADGGGFGLLIPPPDPALNPPIFGAEALGKFMPTSAAAEVMVGAYELNRVPVLELAALYPPSADGIINAGSRGMVACAAGPNAADNGVAIDWKPGKLPCGVAGV